MWHLDIPKTRQYDNGKVEVVARNSAGEAICETTLTVKPREDDFRGVLKNSPRRKLPQEKIILFLGKFIFSKYAKVNRLYVVFVLLCLEYCLHYQKKIKHTKRQHSKICIKTNAQ